MHHLPARSERRETHGSHFATLSGCHFLLLCYYDAKNVVDSSILAEEESNEKEVANVENTNEL